MAQYALTAGRDKLHADSAFVEDHGLQPTTPIIYQGRNIGGEKGGGLFLFSKNDPMQSMIPFAKHSPAFAKMPKNQ